MQNMKTVVAVTIVSVVLLLTAVVEVNRLKTGSEGSFAVLWRDSRHLRGTYGLCGKATKVEGGCGGGGDHCPPCPYGHFCRGAEDCDSGLCEKERCVLPSSPPPPSPPPKEVESPPSPPPPSPALFTPPPPPKDVGPGTPPGYLPHPEYLDPGCKQYYDRPTSSPATWMHNVSNLQPHKTVILALTARNHWEHRASIRATWGQAANVFFIVGSEPCPYPPEYVVAYTCTLKPGETVPAAAMEEHQATLAAEEERIRAEPNMVFLPMVDFYRALPRKVKLAYIWGLATFPEAEWFVKIDDDGALHHGRLNAELARHNASKAIVLGCIVQNAGVPRGGKWLEPCYKPKSYPPFPIGSCGHALSRPAAAYIADHFESLHEYQGEDVSVGIWFKEDKSLDVKLIKPPCMSNQKQRCQSRSTCTVGHNLSPASIRDCLRS